MTRLPPRRKRAKSGIERGPKRSWPKHEKWVRGHACCVPGCTDGPIVFAHVRSAANAGTGLKPHSAFGVALCDAHHKSQHQHGIETFQRQHGIDLWAIAAEFTKRSPDREMRESLKLVPADEVEKG